MIQLARQRRQFWTSVSKLEAACDAFDGLLLNLEKGRSLAYSMVRFWIRWLSAIVFHSRNILRRNGNGLPSLNEHYLSPHEILSINFTDPEIAAIRHRSVESSYSIDTVSLPCSSCFLMASSKVLMFSIFFALVIIGNWATEEAGAINVDISRSEDSDSALKFEIEQLKFKISSLESTSSEKARDLKSKDERILQFESVIHEMAANVVSLQRTVELLQQEKGAVDAVELVGKANAYSYELEKKVEELKDEIDMQNRKIHDLEAQAIEAEKKVQELDVRLRSVHNAWLPPWLAYRIVRTQEIVAANWKERLKPALDVSVLKVSEKLGQAQKWVELHLETAKVKLIPATKSRWIAFRKTIKPRVEKTFTKTVEIFEFCRNTAKPHIFAFRESANPLVQGAQMFVTPYVELAATCVDKVSAGFKPFAGGVVYGYRKFLETFGTYHRQAQYIVLENLEKRVLTKPLATEGFVWFAVSASLALPVFLIYMMLTKLFGKKAGKRVRSRRSHNHHRRHHQRSHSDQF